MKDKLSKWQPAVLLLALLPFLPNLTSYFLADDFVLLTWTRVHSPADVLGFFDPNTFWFYRPLVKTYYWGGQSVFGLQPLPFHLASLLLHGVTGYLLYRLISYQLKGGHTTGLIAALIFMLIPHDAETVSWIASVGDLVAGACIVGGILLFYQASKTWTQQEVRPITGNICMAGSVILFAIGLFTRETSVLLLPLLGLATVVLPQPSALAVRESWPQRHWGRLVLAFSAYCAVLLIYLVVQLGGGIGSLSGRGGLELHPLNLDSILLGIMEYVHGLIPGGGILGGLSLDIQRVVVWVEVAILVLLGLVLWRTGQRLALFGLCWMVSTPLIFIFFSVPTDRYFYVPSIGYGIFIASLVTWLVQWVANKPVRGSDTGARVIGVILVGGLLLAQAVLLLGKEYEWRRAGQASAEVLHDVQQAVPKPHDYAVFHFVDVPATLDGVPFFNGVLQQAVQLRYNNVTLAASNTTCAGLDLALASSANHYIFRFTGESASQISAWQCH